MTGQYEPQPTQEDVGERVHNRIALIAERGSLFTVSPNDQLRVLDHFPKGLDRDRKPESPDRRELRGDQSKQPVQREPVEEVREAVWVQQVLRVIRTPGVARPQQK